MTENTDGSPERHRQGEIAPPPPGETPVSQDSRRLWLLAIGVIAVLAIVAGNFPGRAEQNGYASAGIRAIAVDVSGTNVAFPEAAGNEISVSLSGPGAGRYQLETNQVGDTLEVRARRGFMTFIPFIFGRTQLTVALPAGFDGELRAETSSGRIDLDGEGRGFGSASLAASSGRITVEDATFSGDVRLSASSGRIELSDLAVAGALDVTTSSGLIGMTDVSADGYRLQASSGRVRADGLAGTALTASTSSGRLEIGARTMLADWQLRTSSGRVSVELENPPADMSIDFSASSGSANVASRYGLADTQLRGNSLQVRRSGPELHVRTSSGRFDLQ